ncbi:hypothetical protein B0O99DRAFT_679009 [Bisporella sp. PMI_857]|nr:hypothetical protein B0O99DRAFT_679009 [Bisporella sp. PMI_857]
MRNWISSPRLQLLIVSICLVSPVTSYNDYISKYYYGKPDPIGVDFAPTYATAVYADSERNFTVIGHADGVSENGNGYARYIEALHSQAMNWGSPSPIIDDSHQFESDVWHERAGIWLSSWYQQIKRRACCTIRPLLKTTKSAHQICCPSNAYKPRLPRSQYQHLVSQYKRTMLLKRLMPKYFRPSMTPQPLTKSEFVFLIYQLLADLKSQAQEAHNITITSAIIVVPPWVPYDLRKLFDEAAFLAGIGTFQTPFDEPHSRVEMAVRTASPSSRQSKKTVMVLDHGQYHLSAHHFVMDEWNGPSERFHSRAFILGSRWIWANLGTRLIEGLNSNVTEEVKIPRGAISGNELLKIIDGRIVIKSSTRWPEDLEFTNRSKSINITELSGRTRLFNMTGADVQEVEEQYTAKVVDLVQHLLLRHDMMTEYFRTRPDWETISKLSNYEHWKLSLDVAANVLPPVDTGSWFHSVDELIILDDGWEVELLDQAARKALAWKDAVPEEGMGICIPASEIAARGAALRALELISLYEDRQREAEEMREIRDQRSKKEGWNGEENRASFLYGAQMEQMRDQKVQRDKDSVLDWRIGR